MISHIGTPHPLQTICFCASLYGFYSRLIVEDVPRNGSGQPSPDLTALNLAILKVFKSFQLIDNLTLKKQVGWGTRLTIDDTMKRGSLVVH